MTLTDEQVATLHTDIISRPELQAFIDGGPGDDVALLQYYNNENEPTQSDCWKTRLTIEEVSENINWTAFIARSQAERDAFRTMFMGPASVNPSVPTIRSAFAARPLHPRCGAAAARRPRIRTPSSLRQTRAGIARPHCRARAAFPSPG